MRLPTGAMLALFAAAAHSAPPSFWLHKTISSHMVLQAESPTIFGFCSHSPHQLITSEGETSRCIGGKWLIKLKPREASFKPTNLTVTDSSNNHTILIEDVLFGDVW